MKNKKLFGALILILFTTFLCGCNEDTSHFLGATLEQEGAITVLKISKINIDDSTAFLRDAKYNLTPVLSNNIKAQLCIIFDRESKNELQFKFYDGIYFVMKDGSFSTMESDFTMQNTSKGMYIDLGEFRNTQDNQELVIPLNKIQDPTNIKGVVIFSRGSNYSYKIGGHSEKNDRRATYMPVEAVKTVKDKITSWIITPDPEKIRTNDFDAQAEFVFTWNPNTERNKKDVYELLTKE